MKLRRSLTKALYRSFGHLRVVGRVGLRILPTIAQISIVLATLTFLQQQDPLVAEHIDHQTKTLSLHNSGFVPVSVRSYAMEFRLNLIEDADHHGSINKDNPISGFSTRGPFIPGVTIWPFSTRTRDLTKSQLNFDEWHGQDPDYVIYCLAFEKTSWFGRTSDDVLLTPKLKFSASAFGPLPPTAAIGGGYPKTLIAVEKQIRSDCLTFFEKTR